jgi:hypothetical protein
MILAKVDNMQGKGGQGRCTHSMVLDRIPGLQGKHMARETELF